jgi:hypothetical protein
MEIRTNHTSINWRCAFGRWHTGGACVLGGGDKQMVGYTSLYVPSPHFRSHINHRLPDCTPSRNQAGGSYSTSVRMRTRATFGPL